MSLLEVKNLKKVYKTRLGGTSVEALRNVNFSVEDGEFVAIMGESGSGKTTLLNILAALDKPTAGTVLLEGRDFSKIKESAVAEFRRDNLDDCGFYVYVCDLLVMPEQRGKDIGRKLMECIYDDYPDRIVYVMSDVDAYYEKQGYRREGSVFEVARSC